MGSGQGGQQQDLQLLPKETGRLTGATAAEGSAPELRRVQAMLVNREALGDRILMNVLWNTLLP